MYNIVLYQPEIPQNTGNIVRTCACTGSALHLIKPLGFDVSESAVKRAGLDYWDKVSVTLYEDYEVFLRRNQGAKCYYLSKKANKSYAEAVYEDGCFLVFGKETKGLPDEMLRKYENDALRIPMISGVRCLNLSNSVAVVLYEALRSKGFPGLI